MLRIVGTIIVFKANILSWHYACISLLHDQTPFIKSLSELLPVQLKNYNLSVSVLLSANHNRFTKGHIHFMIDWNISTNILGYIH